MEILQAIYDSELGRSMRESLWGYPIALTVHSVGMGILVGVLAVMNLRILGMFRRRMPFQVVKPIIWLGMFGFVINLISGLLLFIADPISYSTNTAFLVKIAGVIIGLVVLVMMIKTPEFKEIKTVEAAAVGGTNLQVLAYVSLAVWTIALIAGRLIGYMM